MTALTPPDYGGGSLINLVAELEYRLTGHAVSPRLHTDLSARIPEASTYVVVLYDGLGTAQLDHPRAGSLASHLSAAIDAPFPTTTTVALASVATGLPPSRHGLLGYQLWMPEIELVVNTIKWTTLWGEPVAIATDDLLPAPNLWERLTAAGREPITVQPAAFTGSPLSRLLYPYAKFNGRQGLADPEAATLQVDSTIDAGAGYRFGDLRSPRLHLAVIRNGAYHSLN